MIICLDGKYINPAKSRSSYFLKPLQYGEGVFETIRITQGVPEYLKLHLARLKEGARFIGVTVPSVDYELLVRKLLKKNSLSRKLARLKIIIFPGEKSKRAHLCMTVEPYDPPDRKNYATGARLLMAKHPLCESDVARIKSICRLPYAKLREKAANRGYFDCLLTDGEGRILETTVANVFMWDQGKFLIPPIDSNRLRGIMERMVVGSLKKSGFPVGEKNIKLKELNSQKGMLITNSLIGVMPVKAIGKTLLRNITAEPGVKELIRKFSPF